MKEAVHHTADALSLACRKIDFLAPDHAKKAQTQVVKQ